MRSALCQHQERNFASREEFCLECPFDLLSGLLTPSSPSIFSYFFSFLSSRKLRSYLLRGWLVLCGCDCSNSSLHCSLRLETVLHPLFLDASLLLLFTPSDHICPDWGQLDNFQSCFDSYSFPRDNSGWLGQSLTELHQYLPFLSLTI